MFTLALTLIGLILFEVVASIDNAVVNADVLATMKNKRTRRFFLTWGILFAVFVVRGLLPSLIVFLADPSIGIFGAQNFYAFSFYQCLHFFKFSAGFGNFIITAE